MTSDAYARFCAARDELRREVDVALRDVDVRALVGPLGRALREAPPINHNTAFAAALDNYPAVDAYDLLAVEVVARAMNEEIR